MIDTKEIQRLMDDINFAWTDTNIMVKSGVDGRIEVRSVSSFSTIFALLVEILFELKRQDGTPR